MARAFLIEHPHHGLILIDTGYGKGYLEASKKGWGWLYDQLLPVSFQEEERVANQLMQDGIKPSDLSHLIITHFHPDHIGALGDFASTPWVYRHDILEKLTTLPPRKQFQQGFLKKLVPSIPKGSISLTASSFDTKWHDFEACDLFDDASLTLVDLPGHALGQMGVSIQDQLFAADALWSTEAPPHPLGILLQNERKKYRQTHEKLMQLSRKLTILPTHTAEPHE